jgi:Tfp pilus assembly protein PilO
MHVSRTGVTRTITIRRLGVPLALALIALAADAIIYAAVLAPSRAVVDQTDTTWRSERDRIARFKTYQQAHEQVSKLTERATAREDLPEVVTTLASLAKRRGLKIPEVNYQPERVDLKDFQKVSLTFALSGPYANVRRFLDDLERSSPFLAVESLALERAKKKEEGEIEVQVKVAAYLRTA